MGKKTITIRVSEPGWYAFSATCDEGKVSANVFISPEKPYLLKFNLPESTLKRYDVRHEKNERSQFKPSRYRRGRRGIRLSSR